MTLDDVIAAIISAADEAENFADFRHSLRLLGEKAGLFERRKEYGQLTRKPVYLGGDVQGHFHMIGKETQP